MLKKECYHARIRGEKIMVWEYIIPVTTAIVGGYAGNKWGRHSKGFDNAEEFNRMLKKSKDMIKHAEQADTEKKEANDKVDA